MAEAEPKPEAWRVGLAFVLAPLVAALAFSLIEDGPLWDVPLIGAYGPATVLGVPIYFLLRNRIRMRLVASVIFGGLIAALPWFVLTMLPGAPDATVGDCAAVIDGKTTWCGFSGTLWWLGQIALYGTFGGLVFGICAAWQPRRL